ncbi:MAG: glycosyltransferase, partial [Phormidesmis sp. CAN_BIN36]|nr:glycosyltransferase [Phormidesmis sp. CAN_BIN36]
IYMAPFQNQSLMPRTYAIASLVVLPSYGAGETWGLALNEAMCMARPVIASSHVGCEQDLINTHKNGLVFPAGDILALAHCLQDAFSDRIRLKRWGEESRHRISNYSYIQATDGLKSALLNMGLL